VNEPDLAAQLRTILTAIRSRGVYRTADDLLKIAETASDIAYAAESALAATSDRRDR
jgi:hypothetical protein